MHRPEFEPVPEIFDIHVMAFADESATTVDALARIFGIDRDVAQRLISEAPVVVKRAASPEVANSLLDALGELGAQVVLLPSQSAATRAPVSQRIEANPVAAAGGATVDHDDDHDVDDERDFFAAGPLRSDPAPPPSEVGSGAAGWGGLDLEAGDHDSPVAPRAVLEEDPFAVPEPRAPRRPAPARSAPYASFAPPSATQYLAPEARIEEEPSYSDDEEAALGEWSGESDEAASEEEGPPAEDTGGSLELAVPLPTRRARQPEPSLPPRRSTASVPGAGPVRRGPPAPGGPELGLGLVPPLPSLGSLPPLPPPARAPRAGPAQGPKEGAAGSRAGGLRPPMAPLLPEASRAPAVRAPGPAPHQSSSGGAARPGSASHARATSGPVAKQSGWLSRGEIPSGPDLPRVAALTGMQPAVAPASPAPAPAPAQPAPALSGLGVLSDERLRPTAATAVTALASPPARHTSRLVGLLELVAGIGVFAVGLQLDHTVLHGTADTLWLVLHAFALYGVGHGVYSVRP